MLYSHYFVALCRYWIDQWINNTVFETYRGERKKEKLLLLNLILLSSATENAIKSTEQVFKVDVY